MYSQCPNCSTIFDLADEDAGAPQGLVRCGRCREVFNAPWNLVASLPGDEQPGIEVSRDEPAAADPGAGDNDMTGRRPESNPTTESGTQLEGDSDNPQHWTVSEHGTGGTPDPSEGGPETIDQVITETLALSDIATTDEIEHLGGNASETLQPKQVEPDRPGRKKLRRRTEPDLRVPDEVDEEIVIEAPLNLWNIGDEREDLETESAAPVDETTGLPGLNKLEPGTIRIPRHADDVKLVQIPNPKPIQSAALAGAALILVAAVFWQLKQYYISDLAEIVTLRGPLETICEYASCTVPPRTDIKRIDLVGTSVDPHPATPGALRVGANLINRAAFVQPFPPLEVTLTDREGVVVGRRTYLPHEYLSGMPGDMSPNVLQRADLDLAQPAQSAVGYEIQLVSR